MRNMLFVWVGLFCMASAAFSDTTLPLVSISGGTFSMGCNTNLFPEGSSGELPAHTVILRSFYMGRTEVTKAQWDHVAGWAATNGYDISTNSAAGKATNHPAQTLTWYSAVKWCNARSEMEGRRPCYTSGGGTYRSGDVTPDLNLTNTGYRLPTEAEWEYAARGGSATNRFPWRDSNEIQHARANYDSSAVYAYDTSPTRGYHPLYTNEPSPYTAPAGSFATNAYGLCDMAGNVWEWCWDWNGSYSSDPATNPVGAFSGSTRITRGGSYQNVAEMARVTRRNGQYPNYGYNYYGFRVASATRAINPLITSGPAAGSVSKTNATITWQTDLAGDSVVRYGRSASAYEGAVTNAARTTNHTITLTGLHSGSTYRYRVQSSSEAGGSTASADRYFSTISALPTNFVIQPLLVKSPYQWPVRLNVDASGAVQRVEYYVDGAFAGIAYPPNTDFDLTPLSLTNLDLSGIRRIEALVYRLDGSVITQESSWYMPDLCYRVPPRCEPEVLWPPELHYISIAGSAVSTSLTFQVYAAEILGLDSEFESEPGYGHLGPRWDTAKWVQNLTNVGSVAFYLDDTLLGVVSNSVPGDQFTFEQTSYVENLSTGMHQFVAEVFLEGGCNYSTRRPFWVTRQSSRVTVSRSVSRTNQAFTVALEFVNAASNEVVLTDYQESARGFYPVGKVTANYRISSAYDQDENECAVRVGFINPAFATLAPGESLQVAYTLAPVLSVLPDDYRLGSECVTRYQDDYETYTRTNAYESWWVTYALGGVRATTYLHAAVSDAFHTSDYLAVTSPRNLGHLGAATNRDALLEKLAELALAREGVLGFYDAAPAIETSYKSGAQIAAGNCYGGRRDDLFFTKEGDEEDSMRCYRFPSFLSSFSIGTNWWNAGNALTCGNVVDPGGHALDEWVLASGNPATPDPQRLQVVFFNPATHVIETGYSPSSYRSGDGFAAGNVLTGQIDEIVHVYRTNGQVNVYHGLGLTPEVVFPSEFRSGDGLLVADVLGDAAEEIIIVRPGDDVLDIYDLSADPAPMAPTHTQALDIPSVTLVAAGNLAGSARAEIVVGYPDDDVLTAWSFSFNTIYGNLWSRLWRRDTVLAADDQLLVADVLAGGEEEIILARRTRHDKVAAGEIEAQPGGAATGAFDRYGLDALMEPGGNWSRRLTPDWTSEGYLLLVGETEIIPSFTFRYDVPNAGYNTVTLADVGYANMCSELERPELAMGRIIGDDIDALRVPIETALGLINSTYSLANDDAYLVSGALKNDDDGNDWIGNRKSVGSKLREKGFSSILQRGTVGGDPVTVEEFYAEAIGRNVIFLAGHGNPSSWDILSAESVRDRFIPNATRPVVLAHSCSTVRYSQGASFGEEFIGHGAAAYIGATALSFDYSISLHRDFYHRLAGDVDIGTAFKRAKRHRANAGNLNDRRRNRYTCAIYYLFGDPKITMDFGAGRRDVSRRADEPIAGPTNQFSIAVPMFEIVTNDGLDYVSLPGDLEVNELGHPIVPIYQAEVIFPAGHPVQDVQLVLRDGLFETNGLVLPNGAAAPGDRTAVVPRSAGAPDGYWPTNVFAWSTDKNPDGSLSLFVSVFPFYYDSNTTAALFYSNYTFSIDYDLSDISINRLTMDKAVYDTNDAITAILWLQGTSAVPRDVVLEPVLTRSDADTILFLPIQTLPALRGVSSASIEWEAADYAAGEYILTVNARTADGALLDSDLTYFTVGFAAAGATNVTIAPTTFNLGQRVDLSAQFVNRGDQELDADLVILVRDAAGADVAEFRHSISNWQAGASFAFTTNWTATLVPRNCEVYAYVLFDSGQGVQTRQADWADAPLVVESAEARGTNAVLAWPSVAGRTYRIEYTTNLVAPSYTPIAAGIAAMPPLNRQTNGLPDLPLQYWRISEQW